MFVIWRKRKRETYAGFMRDIEVGDVRLTPVVVEAKRVNGKPKQTHIAALPSIIERHINDEKSAVWFWLEVEERLAGLANRIPPDEMTKIREALSKKVPRPDDDFIAAQKAGADAFLKSMSGKFDPHGKNRETNKKLHAFHQTLKTAEMCADCGEKITGSVYRERRSIGRGFMGGSRWTTGVLCETCALKEWRGRYHRLGPCVTCGREVFMSWGVTATRCFCSTRCGQAHYRAERIKPTTVSV